MNDNKKLYLCTVIITLALWATNSLGLGLGISLGSGSEEWTDDPGNNGDRETESIAFVLDTAVQKNRLFNYRLMIALEENTADGFGVDMDALSFTHDFGFGVVRYPFVRVFVGPQLKFALIYDVYGSGVDSGAAIGFSLGPMVGVNVHLPEVASFSLSLGYQLFGGYVGEYDTIFGFTNDLEPTSKGITLNLAVLFRIREHF